MQKSELEIRSEAYLQLRDEPPGCVDLHLRILAETESLPQTIERANLTEVTQFSSTKIFVKRAAANIPARWRHWLSFKPLAMTSASVFAVLVLAIWLPKIHFDPIKPDVVTDSVLSTDAELVWDELLLLQDELAFADL